MLYSPFLKLLAIHLGKCCFSISFILFSSSIYSVVFQDYKIFSLTVAENISATKKYDKEKLYSSFEKADIKDRILKIDNKENTYLYKDLEEHLRNGMKYGWNHSAKRV